jgi:hypothetical protein
MTPNLEKSDVVVEHFKKIVKTFVSPSRMRLIHQIDAFKSRILCNSTCQCRGPILLEVKGAVNDLAAQRKMVLVQT